jgi:hypothetical protein
MSPRKIGVTELVLRDPWVFVEESDARIEGSSAPAFNGPEACRINVGTGINQSLLATRMAMEDMVDACADIDAAGFWSVECWGGATFGLMNLIFAPSPKLSPTWGQSSTP